MTQYVRSITLSVTLVASLAIGAPPASKDPNLILAQAEYAATLAEAKAEYAKAFKNATDEYKGKLKAIQDDRTKEGDLDGAVTVRNLIAELKDVDEPAVDQHKDLSARERFAADLSKVIWSPSPRGWHTDFSFGPDGFVHGPPNERWVQTWAVLAPGTVITYHKSTGVVDLFTIDIKKGQAKVSCPGTTQKPSARWEATKAK